MFKKNLNLILVCFLAAIFFILCASFNYLSQDQDFTKWSSPDETANYFFAKRLSQQGNLSFFDSANLISEGWTIPRSVRSDEGWTKPVSFLGIILIYGSLGAIFGLALIPFLTPLFAALGIIVFYLIIKRLFSDRVALWSAVLLASFPVYIYYSARSMFHNVLFVVLCLFAWYFLLLSASRSTVSVKTTAWFLNKEIWLSLVLAFIGGIFFGLAAITRTSEVLWLLPVVGLIILVYRRHLRLSAWLLSGLGFIAPLIPVAYYNQLLYGAFWRGGYNEMNRSVDSILNNSSDLWRFAWLGKFDYYWSYLTNIFHQVFYFGFKYEKSLIAFSHYVVEMFPLLFGVSLLGLTILIVRIIWFSEKKYLTYLVTLFLLSVYLIFYYGSWQFNDNPDITRFTIGNSYTRYWLPIYLGLMPLASLAIVRVTESLPWHKSQNTVSWRRLVAPGLQATAILIIAIWSLLFVFSGSEEGLLYIYYNNLEERRGVEQVWSLTENESIVITRYHDKFLWPERRVIMGTLPNNEINQVIKRLVAYYPLYYYNFYLNEADVAYLNSRKLATDNLRLIFIKRIGAKFALYRIVRPVGPLRSNNSL